MQNVANKKTAIKSITILIMHYSQMLKPLLAGYEIYKRFLGLQSVNSELLRLTNLFNLAY